MVTDEGIPSDQGHTPSKVYVLRRQTDARGGDNHTRTAAASAAALKLDSKTFLVDPTQSHSVQSDREGVTWSLKIHDFGGRWIESSWGKGVSRPGRRGSKGQSPNKEQNEKRAQARAKGEIRRKSLAIGADHLVSLTYRKNMQDRERALVDLDRLRRKLSYVGYPMPYVAVMECQKRGAIHFHLAVKGFQDVRLLRRCWYKIVGKAQGQINVRGPRPGRSPVKLARYLSKYISKDLDALPREFGEHRYFCSLGIVVPTERFQIVLTRQARDVEREMFKMMFDETLRRIGEYCTLSHWLGQGGAYGWISGFEDPACRWYTNKASPVALDGAIGQGGEF